MHRKRSIRHHPRGGSQRIRRIIDCERRAGSGVENTRHLPASKHLLRPAIRLLRNWQVPDCAADKPVPDIRIGIAIVQARIKGISQTEIAVESRLAERGAQVVLVYGVSVVGRKLDTAIAEVIRVEVYDQRVVVRVAIVTAGIDSRILVVETRSRVGFAEVKGARTWL